MTPVISGRYPPRQVSVPGLMKSFEEAMMSEDSTVPTTTLEFIMKRLRDILPSILAEYQPSTEGPKVVGYVSNAFAAGEQARRGVIWAYECSPFRHPVILQSEHEEVVRKIVVVREDALIRQANEITRLKAENERLDNTAQREAANAQHQYEQVRELEAEVARLRVENERLNEIIRSSSDGK